MEILIVEDEAVIAKHLQYTLKAFGLNAAFTAVDYNEAVEILDNNIIHLALLDITLSGYKTGIDVAEYIRSKFDIPFIFLTSHEELAIVNAALNTSPNAFLNKPFKKINVYTAVSLAINNYRERIANQKTVQKDNENSTVIQDALFIKEKNVFTKIALTDIIYIRSADNYLELHTADKKFMIRETLKNMIEQLPENQFFKTHKSYIINLQKISSINYMHVLIGDNEIPITSENRNTLLGRLTTFS